MKSVQQPLPTEKEVELKDKIKKVIKWLETHQEHSKYEEGTMWVASKLKDQRLLDWFLGIPEFDFIVTMDIYKHVQADQNIEYTKNTFGIKDDNI